MKKPAWIPLLAMVWTTLSPAPAAGQPTARVLTEEQRILHVLNRLGFGPAPGDLAKVREMGIEPYIALQLHPERIADTLVDQRLQSYPVLSMSPAELFRSFPPPQWVRRQARSMERSRDSRDRDRDAGQVDSDSALDPSQQAALRRARKGQRQVQLQLMQARLTRAVFSHRQLQELLVDFWMNHFNVFAGTGLGRIFLPDFENNVVRPRILGRFEDLLTAVAKSPAMLFYLDNWVNSASSEEIRSRAKATLRQSGDLPWRGRQPGRWRGWDAARRAEREKLRPLLYQRLGATPAIFRAEGLNENYARELLELHTLGVDGGYSQEDVEQVARAFTGWTIGDPRQGATFVYQPLMHWKGSKTVLGQTIHEEGLGEGEKILSMLARHPATARHISTKLVRRFVADDPPPDLVEAATRRYLETAGDIREVLRILFDSTHFLGPDAYQEKVKKPFELVASSLRAVGAREADHPFLLRAMAEMGEPLYLCRPPTGYPEVASAWINTDSLLRRLNFALVLAADLIPGVETDLEASRQVLEALDLPAPSAAQLEKTRQLTNALELPSGLLPDRLARVDEETLKAAFRLGSPQFQKR